MKNLKFNFAAWLVVVLVALASLAIVGGAGATQHHAQTCVCSVFGHTNLNGSGWGGTLVHIHNNATGANGSTTSDSTAYYQFSNLSYGVSYYEYAARTSGCFSYRSNNFQWTELGLSGKDLNLGDQVTRIC